MGATQMQYPIDTWAPIVDNKLVVEEPLKIINSGNYSHRKLNCKIIKTNSDHILFYRQSIFFEIECPTNH